MTPERVEVVDRLHAAFLVNERVYVSAIERQLLYTLANAAVKANGGDNRRMSREWFESLLEDVVERHAPTIPPHILVAWKLTR